MNGIEELAVRLPEDAIWIVSGALRCRQTAQALAAARGQGPETLIEPDLLEQDFGAWQGLTHDEIAARDPDGCVQFWRDPAHQAPPGGESFAEVIRRVTAAIERSAAYRDGPLVLIAHAGTIRAALAHALGLDAPAALRFAVDPLSLTRLDRFPAQTDSDAAGWRVVAVNVPPSGARLSSES